MPNPDHIPYHEGLTELLEMKRSMLRVVCRRIMVLLGIAVLLTIVFVLSQSSFWADLRDFLRHCWR